MIHKWNDTCFRFKGTNGCCCCCCSDCFVVVLQGKVVSRMLVVQQQEAASASLLKETVFTRRRRWWSKDSNFAIQASWGKVQYKEKRGTKGRRGPFHYTDLCPSWEGSLVEKLLRVFIFVRSSVKRNGRSRNLEENEYKDESRGRKYHACEEKEQQEWYESNHFNNNKNRGFLKDHGQSCKFQEMLSLLSYTVALNFKTKS